MKRFDYVKFQLLCHLKSNWLNVFTIYVARIVLYADYINKIETTQDQMGKVYE